MTEIKLDFDKPDKPDFARIYAAMRLTFLRVETVKVTRSKHNGWHVTITVKDNIRSKIYITCLQAICGSDWKREVFNLIRADALDGDSAYVGVWRYNWNVLFEADESARRNNVSSESGTRRSKNKRKMGS